MNRVDEEGIGYCCNELMEHKGPCLIEMSNGSYVIAESVRKSGVDTISTTRPVRLVMQADNQGRTHLNLLPYIPFIPKDKQSVSRVSFRFDQVTTILPFEECVKDGGRLLDVYNSFHSAILKVPSLQSVNL